MPNAINMERQAALELTVPDGVAVVGCGGVGSWLAYLLALAGVPHLYLFDHDTVSDHNLNRLPVSREWIGKPKSEAVAALIRTLRPDCDVWALGQFTERNANSLDLRHQVRFIVATTDTLASRRLVHGWAINSYIKYLEVAAEGDIGTISGSPAEWATEAEQLPGYASVPVWVGPCVLASAVAVSYLIHGTWFDDNRVIHIGYANRGNSGPAYRNDPDYNYPDFYFHDTEPWVDPAPTTPPDPQPIAADAPAPEPATTDLIADLHQQVNAAIHVIDDVLTTPGPTNVTIGTATATPYFAAPRIRPQFRTVIADDPLNERQAADAQAATLVPHGDDWQMNVPGEITIDDHPRPTDEEPPTDDEPDSDEESTDDDL